MSVRFTVEILFKISFFFTKLLVLVILFTIKLFTRLKNKICQLLQFIEKIVRFFFLAEFDISTSTKKLKILKSPRKLAFLTFFQLNHMKNYYSQFFTAFIWSGLCSITTALFEICLKARKSSITTMEMILKDDVFFKLHIIL